MSTAIERTLPIIIEPLVRRGWYKSPAEALKEIVLEYVRQKINKAKAEIAALETKYGMTFEEFTEAIKGKASIQEEDDWMQWESALDMLQAWQETEKEILASDV